MKSTVGKKPAGQPWYEFIWVCRMCSAVHCYAAMNCCKCQSKVIKRKNPNYGPTQ